MTDAEKIKELEGKIETYEDAIVEAQRSHSWIMKTMRRKADENSGGNYSDELKYSISTDEMLEKLVNEI